MTRIFKYEIRRRLNTIFILTGLLCVLSIGSILLIAIKGSPFSFNFNIGASISLWYAMTFFALIFIPLVMFFTCSNGHIDELLYQDTNYLMLTIPLKSYKILAGRLLAGFVEFFIYFVVSCVFLIIIIAQNASWFHLNSFTKNLHIFLKQIFVHNFLPVLYFILLIISTFLLVGTVFMCVKALTRSFIRRKKIAQIAAVLIFILLFERVVTFGAYLSTSFDLVQYIDFSHISYFDNGRDMYVNQIHPIPVHLITIVITFVISAGFFATASWLFDKKVEL